MAFAGNLMNDVEFTETKAEEKETKAESDKEKKEDTNKEMTFEEKLITNTKADKATLEDGILTLVFNGDASLSDNTIVTTHAHSTFEALGEAFKNDSVDEVIVKIEANFIDDKGNENRNEALEYIYARDTFEELNFDKFLELTAGEEWRILNESDVYFIHPGIYENIKPEYKRNLENGSAKVPLVEE